MPITKSAKKALRQSLRKRAHNKARKIAATSLEKKIRRLVRVNKRDEAARELPGLYKALDKAAKRGVIKKNTAARKKSRLTALVAKKHA